MSEKTELIAKYEAIIKRTERFQPLFENELFKEWQTILEKKRDAYRFLQTKVPRVGEIKTMEQVTTIGDRREVSKVPYRVTREERVVAIMELQDKIDEIQSIVDMPMLMESDSKRMKDELDKIKGSDKTGD